jgi:glycosyltransferase involved in cell wall biosynthesis
MTAQAAIIDVPRGRPGPIAPARAIRVGFVMHVMQVAGAEVLVARIIRDLAAQIDPVIFCLDRVGELGERLQAEGVEVTCLDRKPGRDWGLVGRLGHLIRARNIDVLHAHQYTPFFYAALARTWARARSTRLIFTEHGRHYPDQVSSLRYWGNRLLFSRMADRINACCQFSADALRFVDGFRSRPVDVIYNGIDVDDYSPAADRTAVRQSLGLSPDRRYLATVARFHPVKDHSLLLTAFATIAAARPDTDLLLIGDGSLRHALERQAESLNLRDRVQFWGVRHDVARILQAIDVFVLPSLSEAASLTLLEAMATECPVVVTDVGGNPEIVREGQDGLRVPRRNPEALAAACLQLLNNPALAESLGRSARQRVLDEFQQRDTVQKFAQLYEVLSRPMTSSMGEMKS